MAKQYFEDEEDKSFLFIALFFIMLISFSLGIKIAGYHAEKHLKEIELPKCTVNDINVAPDKLPNGQAIEDIEKLEVFTSAK